MKLHTAILFVAATQFALCEKIESDKNLVDVFSLSTASLATPVPIGSQDVEHIIFVDGMDRLATDNNSGQSDRPLKTISAGIKKAVQFKKQNESTKVIVRNGVYRESVRFDTYTNYHKNQPDNLTRIIVEGEQFGEVIITGADPVQAQDIYQDGENVLLNWELEWGIQENPTRGTKEVADIVRRREMVFQDGQLLKQVLDSEELTEGSFAVEEAFDRIVVRPFKSREMSFEIGAREILWNQNHENEVEIRNLIFEKASTPWRDEKAAVIIASSDKVNLTNCEIRWNNGRGFLAVNSDDVSLQSVKMNYNGWDGWGTWRVNRFSSTDTETSHNNWRGHLGSFYIWSVGNKLLATHGLKIDRHISKGNYSRGLWLDYDNTDVVINNLELIDNLKDGVFIEANPGPIVIQGGRITGNGEYGIRAANSEGVELTGIEIDDNNLGAIHLTGVDDGRELQDWDTKKVHRLYLTDWKWHKNQLGGGSQSEYVISTTMGKKAWAMFHESLSSNENIFNTINSGSLFESPLIQVSKWKLNSGMDLDEWKEETGLDKDSSEK